MQFIHDELDKGSRVDAVYTDFSKPFDKVHHKTLMVKLQNAGVHGNLLQWIESYLSNYSRVVTFNGYRSDAAVSSGIPQGLHMGPILFSIDATYITNHIELITLKLSNCSG